MLSTFRRVPVPIPHHLLTRALLLSLSLSLLLGTASCRSRAFELDEAAAVAEDELFERLMDEYVASRFEFYPVEATQAGLPGNDDRLGDYTRTAIDGRVRALTDYRQKLTGLRPTRLSDTAHLDLLWLTSLVKAELFELEERRRWSLTASFYAEIIRSGVVSLLLSGDLQGKSGALAGRLDEVPRIVDYAKANLTLGSALWLEDGIASLERCRALLNELPVLLEQSLPSYRVADLAERSRVGVRAIQSLISVLATTEPATSESPSLGRERLQLFLLYGEMIDRPVEELLDEANRAVVAETDALTEIALESYPGTPLRELLGEVEPERVSVDEGSIRTVAEEIRKAIGVADAVQVRLVPETFLPEPMMLWRPAALEPVKEPVLLVSAGPAELGLAELRLLALTELSPRLQQFGAQARAASLLRRVVASSVTSEGFRAWQTGRRLVPGLATDDPRLMLEYRRRSLVENVRLVGTLAIHSGLMDLEEVERLFLERGFLTASEARAETRRAALYPSVSAAALGRLMFSELAHDYRRAFPLSREDAMTERILREGLIPLRLLRTKLFGGEVAGLSS